MATGFILVAENKQNNCSVDVHCSTQEKDTLKRKLADEDIKPDGKTEMKVPRMKNVKQLVREENGFKRDNTFTDVLKNLLDMVDKAKPNTVTLPSVKPVAPSASGTTPASSSPEASNATPIPTASPTTEATSTASSESVATTAATVSPTPTSSTSVTSSANVSTPTEGSPGKNVTVAPGIVIAPSGEIILNPHFPLLAGAGQTTGSFPFPIFGMPGIALPGIPASSGTATHPGTVAIPSGTTAASVQG